MPGKEKTPPLEDFAPPFVAEHYREQARWQLQPFFTNLDRPVYVPIIVAPEVIGALCSRASRAASDLRTVFLNEYVSPFLEPVREEKDTDETWADKQAYGAELRAFLKFLHEHPLERIFSNPRARSFYAKWLAQYGDDSIAQMAGMHLVYTGLSQVAIKHLEDQRIGLAPLEKSTRYVDYMLPVGGHWAYYTDPTLAALGLKTMYREAMDGLFQTYAHLRPRLQAYLASQHPDEKPTVVEKKAFDCLRGLLPASTLSQVAFFGNGQAFEYLVHRCTSHQLGEVRWAGQQAFDQLYQVTPSFLRRLQDPLTEESRAQYRAYRGQRGMRMAPFVDRWLPAAGDKAPPKATVSLVEYDPEGEAKVMAAMLYDAPNNRRAWLDVVARVRALPTDERRKVVDAYFAGRTQRWQKVGRALEQVYVRFEILMNIGAWRDLHRHRMQTQQRQLFSTAHGYDLPAEVVAAGLGDAYEAALTHAADAYEAIAAVDRERAQYAVPMAYRVRFLQWTNLRQCFWEIELRTIPEGHPDYRHIEQEKFRCLQRVYPLLMSHLRVNLGSYDFARRGQEEKIEAKLKSLSTLPVT